MKHMKIEIRYFINRFSIGLYCYFIFIIPVNDGIQKRNTVISSLSCEFDGCIYGIYPKLKYLHLCSIFQNKQEIIYKALVRKDLIKIGLIS